MSIVTIAVGGALKEFDEDAGIHEAWTFLNEEFAKDAEEKVWFSEMIAVNVWVKSGTYRYFLRLLKRPINYAPILISTRLTKGREAPCYNALRALKSPHAAGKIKDLL